MVPAKEAKALDAAKKVMIEEPMVLTSRGAEHLNPQVNMRETKHEAARSRNPQLVRQQREKISRAAPARSPCCLPLQFGTGAS